MAFNPMQQQQSPDMLMAMMTDPRATPQQRMAAMSALNAMRGGANAPPPPQMTGDSTGVSQMDPAFMAAVRQEMLGQGPEEQPEIPQRQAAPEAPQNPSTEALMSGAADADKVAAMARGGAVKGYAGSGAVQGYVPDPMIKLLQDAEAKRREEAESNIPVSQNSDPSGLYADIRKRLADSENVDTSKDKYMALLQAGLGTMAAASQPGGTFLGSIGQGGLLGVKQLQEAKAARAERDMKNLSLRGTLAEHEAALQQARTKQIEDTETKRQNQAREAIKDLSDLDYRKFAGGESADLRRQGLALQETLGNQSLTLREQGLANQGILAQIALDKAPKGVAPPSVEAGNQLGIPIKGIFSPYAKIASPKAQEELYQNNQKLFNAAQTKQAAVLQANSGIGSDLQRFNEINEKNITGPSLRFSTVSGVKRLLDPEIQEAESITARLVPFLRNGLPGSSSNLDVTMFKSAGPEISKDMKANRNRIAALNAAFQNQSERTQFNNDFFTVHSHMDGADREWKKYLEANPIFDHSKGAKPYTLNADRKTYSDWFKEKEYGQDAPTAGATPVPAPAKPPAARAALMPPPSDAIDMLKKDPGLKDFFIKKYGQDAYMSAIGGI